MADTKITDLATGTTVHSDDWLVFVDTHDTTIAIVARTKGQPGKRAGRRARFPQADFRRPTASTLGGIQSITVGLARVDRLYRHERRAASVAAELLGSIGQSAGEGSSGQLQYNSSGNLAGAADISVAAPQGQLNLASISTPGTQCRRGCLVRLDPALPCALWRIGTSRGCLNAYRSGLIYSVRPPTSRSRPVGASSA